MVRPAKGCDLFRNIKKTRLLETSGDFDPGNVFFISGTFVNFVAKESRDMYPCPGILFFVYAPQLKKVIQINRRNKNV